MSTQASVIAIGPFSRELAVAGHYEYPESWYDRASPGDPIMTETLNAVTRDGAVRLANALAVEYDNPARWKVPTVAAVEAERALRDAADDGHFEVKEVEAFVAFVKAGYSFWFRLDA